MTHFKNPGPKPVITFEEYKKILEFKKTKEDSKKSYSDLAEELGLRVGTLVNAARRGIKRYDYRIMLEEKENESR